MVDWFAVVTNCDDNSGLALLFASELSLPGLDFIEAILIWVVGANRYRNPDEDLPTERIPSVRLNKKAGSTWPIFFMERDCK
jgi:hypothetical protein